MCLPPKLDPCRHLIFSVTCGSEADLIVGSLCCETAEEAKTLIPSLANKISDADLQALLEDIAKLQNFVD